MIGSSIWSLHMAHDVYAYWNMYWQTSFDSTLVKSFINETEAVGLTVAHWACTSVWSQVRHASCHGSLMGTDRSPWANLGYYFLEWGSIYMYYIHDLYPRSLLADEVKPAASGVFLLCLFVTVGGFQIYSIAQYYNVIKKYKLNSKSSEYCLCGAITRGLIGL